MEAVDGMKESSMKSGIDQIAGAGGIASEREGKRAKQWSSRFGGAIGFEYAAVEG
jgi:hypothetical protein